MSLTTPQKHYKKASTSTKNTHESKRGKWHGGRSRGKTETRITKAPNEVLGKRNNKHEQRNNKHWFIEEIKDLARKEKENI